MTSPADDLRVAVDRLIGRVAHWTPTRWSKPCESGPGTRADRVHALAQDLADAAGGARRPVPRLSNDLALPDQLRVLTADAVAAGAVTDALVERVRQTASAL